MWYFDRDTPVQRAFEALKTQKIDDFDRADPFWQVNPFVDFPGDYGGTQYRFEWEREWRVPGELHFGPDDVSFQAEEDGIRRIRLGAGRGGHVPVVPGVRPK